MIQFLLAALLASAQVVTWSDLARKLSGESEATKLKVMAQLRSIPNLKAKLNQGLLTSDRALALDVISALQLEAFMDDLLAQSGQDADGSIALTLNALLTRANSENVTQKYRSLLETSLENLSPSFIVAALDPLGRLNVPLSHKLIEKLFDHPFFEVRAAALYYVRLHLIRHHRTSLLDMLDKALTVHPYQVRLQAISIAAEMKNKINLSQVLSRCQQDANPTVRQSCQNMAKLGLKK